MSKKKFINKQRKLIKTFGDLSDLHSNQLETEDRHKIRTTLRREQVMLKFLKEVIPNRDYRPVMKKLKSIKADVGRIRELEIAKVDACRFQLPIEKIEAKLKKVQKEVKPNLTRKNRMALHSELKAVQKKSLKIKKIPFDLEVLRIKEACLQNLHKKKFTKEELHSLRILVKKVRYILEVLDTPKTKIIELQDKLGRMHDIEVLEETVKSTAKTKEAHQKLKSQILRSKNSILRQAIQHLEKISR